MGSGSHGSRWTPGVSSSLVHYHFDTREELLAQALAWSYEHVGMQRSDIEQDAGATHAQRLGRIIDQCLPLTDELREDWVVWMELWLRAVRHPELQPVAEELYARLHDWFADEIAAGIAAGEFAECDADRGRRPHAVAAATGSASAT